MTDEEITKAYKHLGLDPTTLPEYRGPETWAEELMVRLRDARAEETHYSEHTTSTEEVNNA